MFVLLASRNFFVSSRKEHGVQNNKVPLLLHTRLRKEHYFYECQFGGVRMTFCCRLDCCEQLHVRNPPLYCSIILESQNPPQLNLLQTWTLTLPLPTVDINACTNWAGAATTSFTMSIKTVSNLTQTFLTDQGLCLPDRHTEPQNERTEHGVKSTKVVSQEVTIKYLAINYRDIHQNPYVIKCLSQLLLKPLVRIFRHLLVFKYFSFLSTHNSSFHFIINNAPARCTTAPPAAASITVWPLAIHFFIIILWWLMLLLLCAGLLKWSSCECHPPTSLVRLMASATKLDY